MLFGMGIEHGHPDRTGFGEGAPDGARAPSQWL